MICRVSEKFEFSDIENKVLSEFQDLLSQMKDNATQKETQRIIEDIYCNIISLVLTNNEPGGYI
jgi:hypothetical protein